MREKRGVLCETSSTDEEQHGTLDGVPSQIFRPDSDPYQHQTFKSKFLKSQHAQRHGKHYQENNS